MADASSVSAAVGELIPTFAGHLVAPSDTGYDEARTIHNGLIQKRPALIAQCQGTADIVDAVRLARKLNLQVSVRGGGHNVAGRSVIDGGFMIDLSPMKGIHVDAKARIARAQGGVTWAEFNRETQLHGLATTGGVVSTTGIAGLTLGGGLGWLLGRHGLAVDNLSSVEVVLADGSVVRASQDENPDLFWALRGGGGNFGIAASFEFRLHQVGPKVVGGLVFWPWSDAAAILKLFREQASSAADELTLVASVLGAPDGSGAPAVVMGACHCGSLQDGETAVRSIKSFGTPTMDVMGPTHYCELNTMLDAGYPKGARNYWKSHFVPELTDEAIAMIIDCYSRCPSPTSEIYLEHIHGAAARVGRADTAFPLRSTGYNLLVLAQWMDPALDEQCIGWARESYAAIQPFVGLGRYVNYLDADESGDAALAAYGANYRRLQQIKAKYDPENFFHMNQNIRPLT